MPAGFSTRRAPLLACAVGTALLVRRVGTRSGATDAEVGATLPGDGLVPEPRWASTRAVRIEAAPDEVWPWLAQMGYPTLRAGWYTPHWLDRLQWGIRSRSADRVHPELQRLEVGDRIPDSPDWTAFFTVAEVEPGRALVLFSTRHLLQPLRAVAFSWAFVLEPAGPGETRLLIRARVRGSPDWALRLLWPLLAVGDWVNASAMLRGIRARSERSARRGR
jgi:hypothetical protein